MGAGSSGLNNEVHQLTSRFNALDGAAIDGYTTLQGKFNSLDKTFRRLDDGFDILDGKFRNLDEYFSSITAVTALAATVGSASSGLVKRVDALEAAPSGAVVVPVNVRPIFRDAVGAQVQMTACYPDKDRKLRDFFEQDCKSRGPGWSHDRRDTPVFNCGKVNGTMYKMGICMMAP